MNAASTWGEPPPITEEDIERLLARFYARVRGDDVLGPVFAQAVGVSEAEWAPHMRRLESFWSSVMRGTGRYHGDPFSTHLKLPSIEPAMFDRWLGLFEAACDETLQPGQRAAFVERAHRIARSLRMGLFERLPDRNGSS